MITATSVGTDEAQIRLAIENWAKALRNKDADGVISHYTTDLVHFSLAPPLQYAGAAAQNKKRLEEWFSTWQGPLEYEVEDLLIKASDSVAFSHSLNRMSGTNSDGSKRQLWFRLTLCFEKIDGQWKIAHEHDSVPFYMDGSARAALDLEP